MGTIFVQLPEKRLKISGGYADIKDKDVTNKSDDADGCGTICGLTVW
ncbi:MAG: hypothetical protein K2N63_16805 [Lachnospiraceae bacterium]|nr:hypothetical protein [Lachnospiraceae bacterium]